MAFFGEWLAIYVAAKFSTMALHWEASGSLDVFVVAKLSSIAVNCEVSGCLYHFRNSGRSGIHAIAVDCKFTGSHCIFRRAVIRAIATTCKLIGSQQ